MRLDLFSNPEFDRGASRAKEAAWVVLSGLCFSTWLPGSGWRVALLKLFGARIGLGVVIKPRVRVTFPWRLILGDHVWIGDTVWIDNLAPVEIGAQSCLSQGAYLCTGSHDWSDPRFGLVIRPITLEGECWVGARASLAPGTMMEQGAVLTMGAVGRGNLKGWAVHDGSDVLRPRIEKTGKDQMAVERTA